MGGEREVHMTEWGTCGKGLDHHLLALAFVWLNPIIPDYPGVLYRAYATKECMIVHYNSVCFCTECNTKVPQHALMPTSESSTISECNISRWHFIDTFRCCHCRHASCSLSGLQDVKFLKRHRQLRSHQHARYCTWMLPPTEDTIRWIIHKVRAPE